ncbi:MAG: hypothetical protein L0H93_19510, partial [Nocardioides sp.]|nr:hypothetical protein [Nocardioides sp.]
MTRPPIAPDAGDGEEDDDRIERWAESLSPEERDRLVATARDAVKRMSDAMVAKIDFSGIVKTEAMMSAAMRNIQLPKQSVMRSLMESQRAWQRRSFAINSD